MRWSGLGLAALCCSCVVSAWGGEGAEEDAAKELAALGEKAKGISTLYLVAYASMPPSSPEPKSERAAVLLLWYDKPDQCFRTDEVKQERVTTCLVNHQGAFQWTVNRKTRAPAHKAFRWPREQWLPTEGNEMRTGVAGLLLAALNGYKVMADGFAIARAKEPALPLDDTTWFAATPKPGGPFAKAGEMSLCIGVDNKTGLLVAISSEASGERGTFAIVSVEVNPTIRDAFRVPSSVRAVGIRDAQTGKDIELPAEK